MKKLQIITALLCLCFSTQVAHADGRDRFYVGVDGIQSRAYHSFKDIVNGGGLGTKQTNAAYGFGVNAGYKMNFSNNVFVSPEIFYDQLDNSAYDFSGDHNGVMEVNNRYGGKVNLGYNLTPDLGAFVSLGVANVRYINRDTSAGLSTGDHKVAPIYGVGVLYRLNNHWALKAAYDYQKYNQRYYSDLPGRKDVVSLHVYRVGVVYSF